MIFWIVLFVVDMILFHIQRLLLLTLIILLFCCLLKSFLWIVLRISPARPSIIAFTPSAFPMNRSNDNPNIIPIEVPYVFPINIPINSESIIKRFGFIPAILNQLKKFDCKKYINKNVIYIIIIDSIFFILAPLFLFC